MYNLKPDDKKKLLSCRPDLIVLFTEVSRWRPIKIICGYRTVEEQFELYKKGRELVNEKWVVVDKSKVVTNCDGFIKSSDHNEYPSNAVDVAPLVDGKIPWDDKQVWLSFVEYVKGVADVLNIMVRNGGKWGDYPHWY